ncbi:MAG TPA: hypothetical protein VFA04_24370 [Bryobacteraceae bacterium]|nr:hypothetical protein [Bryobacteraceae bacterium]
MALFNDGPISGIVDLMNYETSILDVASTEGIDTSAKLQLAQSEIAAELLRFLLETERGAEPSVGISPRRSLGVGDVVVTDILRRWHTLRTLAFVFRDAYDNQLNDRYQGKWANYDRMQGEAKRAYLKTGVGLVCRPAPRPAAPAITTVTGTSQPGTYYFGTSWVTADGGEGVCSDPAAIALTDSTQAVISPGAGPDGIVGWNVYAGPQADDLSQQNTAALPVGNSWIQPMPLTSGGVQPGTGQAADRWIVNDQRLRRG